WIREVVWIDNWRVERTAGRKRYTAAAAWLADVAAYAKPPSIRHAVGAEKFGNPRIEESLKRGVSLTGVDRHEGPHIKVVGCQQAPSRFLELGDRVIERQGNLTVDGIGILYRSGYRARADVILEVLSNTWQVQDHLHTLRLQMIGGSHAGEHQKMRRTD